MFREALHHSRLVGAELCAIVLLCSHVVSAQQCDGAFVGTYSLTCDECSAPDPNGHPHCSFSGNVQLTTSCQADSWRTKSDYPLQQVTGGGNSAGCDAAGPARCPALVNGFQIVSVSGQTITVGISINNGEVQGEGCSGGVDASFERTITGAGCCAAVCADSSACAAAGREYSSNGCVCSTPTPPPCIEDQAGPGCQTVADCCSGYGCGGFDTYCGCDDEDCGEQEGICYQGQCTFGSPVLVPTAQSQAYQLTSPSDGVQFDISGTGRLNQIAWTRPAEDLAFLAVDRNGDGKISSGRELFGNFTVPGVTNGFAALAALTNHVGAPYVSADDPEFSKVLLWTDRNHNGISEPEELQPAGNVIRRIGLIPVENNRRDGDGNLFRFRSSAELVSGRIIYIYDVFLRVAR